MAGSDTAANCHSQSAEEWMNQESVAVIMAANTAWSARARARRKRSTTARARARTTKATQSTRPGRPSSASSCMGWL